MIDKMDLNNIDLCEYVNGITAWKMSHWVVLYMVYLYIMQIVSVGFQSKYCKM